MKGIVIETIVTMLIITFLVIYFVQSILSSILKFNLTVEIYEERSQAYSTLNNLLSIDLEDEDLKVKIPSIEIIASYIVQKFEENKKSENYLEISLDQGSIGPVAENEEVVLQSSEEIARIDVSNIENVLENYVKNNVMKCYKLFFEPFGENFEIVIAKSNVNCKGVKATIPFVAGKYEGNLSLIIDR